MGRFRGKKPWNNETEHGYSRTDQEYTADAQTLKSHWETEAKTPTLETLPRMPSAVDRMDVGNNSAG